MIDKVYKAIKEYELAKKGDKILIGLSGGADSVCLTHVLYTLCDTLGITLHTAHMNHNIRGSEAQNLHADIPKNLIFLLLYKAKWCRNTPLKTVYRRSLPEESSDMPFLMSFCRKTDLIKSQPHITETITRKPY